MKSLTFCFMLIAVFSFAKVCEGADVSEDLEDVSVELSAAEADVNSDEVDSDEVDSVIQEIESEIEEAVAETEETSVLRKPSLPLMFPGLTGTGKSQRTLNKDMAVKVASLMEQAVLLVANDILQTAVLLQTDPADFLQANTTSTSE